MLILHVRNFVHWEIQYSLRGTTIEWAGAASMYWVAGYRLDGAMYFFMKGASIKDAV